MFEAELELPRKLHEVVKVAIKDVKACYADPNYVLSMGVWHVKKSENTGVQHVKKSEVKCHVCMAGAVMAKTLNLGMGAKGGGRVVPHHWPWAIENALLAIDSVRIGNINRALRLMRVPEREYPKDLDTFPQPFRNPFWTEGFSEFIESWEISQKWLEERNL